MKQLHSFHIPVMGLAYTIDTPIRVAQYGIDSAISIVDDELTEKMRAFYSSLFELPFIEISKKEIDYRAQRITAYLDLVGSIVNEKYNNFCSELASNSDKLISFLEMLPAKSAFKKGLENLSNLNSGQLQRYLSEFLKPGSIDVNIMTKVDRTNFSDGHELPAIYNDAHAAVRGFANSKLNSSLILSAGMNPSLYAYIAEFADFFPDTNGALKKKIILKVSDFRSALIQGSFLAKKGIWVSEYRIESGLNCGGHAFATDGMLLGPVMEEFKNRKQELISTTHELLIKCLSQTGKVIPQQPLPALITVQGGVGTNEEHEFLLDYYKTDSVGWGSPFLLVPEATTTDSESRVLLAKAKEADFFLSPISPLGIPFNTVKGTSNEFWREKRIVENKSGSSCPKKLLALNRTHDAKGICTASRKFQKHELQTLEDQKNLISPEQMAIKKAAILQKSCLCVGLANPAYLANDIKIKGEAQGVVVCPGPNLAYFDREYSLREMIQHIYGYHSVLAEGHRPHMFLKELQLYVDYIQKEIENSKDAFSAGQVKKWKLFKTNLLSGIEYYKELFSKENFSQTIKKEAAASLEFFKEKLDLIPIPVMAEML